MGTTMPVVEPFLPFEERPVPGILAPMRALGLGMWVVIAGLGCGAVQKDVDRAQTSHAAGQHRDALVWLEHLEPQVGDMDRDLRARFYYLRGMVAHALGHEGDALHFLALARAEAALGGAGGLDPQQRESLESTLASLTPAEAGGGEDAPQGPQEQPQ
jgi:hypothetical protein